MTPEEEKAQQEAEAKAKAESDAKAKAEAEQKARAEADAKAKAEAEQKARAEATAAAAAKAAGDQSEAVALAIAKAVAAAMEPLTAELRTLTAAQAAAGKAKAEAETAELQARVDALPVGYRASLPDRIKDGKLAQVRADLPYFEAMVAQKVQLADRTEQRQPGSLRPQVPGDHLKEANETMALLYYYGDDGEKQAKRTALIKSREPKQ